MSDGVSFTILRPPEWRPIVRGDEATAFTAEGLIPVVLAERLTNNDDLQVAYCMALCFLCLPCTTLQLLFGKKCCRGACFIV